MPRTLFDKIWDATCGGALPDGTCVLYIDRHLVHEVTSPQAFEGLRLAGARCAGRMRRLRWPTTMCRPATGAAGIKEPESRLQVETLEANVAEFGVPYFPVLDARQGIVHIIGPEQGISACPA
jgi:3-isopropylmalate/(R)-2-methylmalate dehydratase large subunit